MRTIIYPAKKCWNTARKLKEELLKVQPNKILLAGKNNPRFKLRTTDKLINWGNSKRAIWHNKFVDLLNIPEQNALAINKLRAFEKFKEHGIPHPEWTTDFNTAMSWLSIGSILARTILTGFGGEGCHYIEKGTDVIDLANPVKIYVKYIKKKHEYRVHVFQKTVIDITQKKKRKGFENPDTKIRNHKNGWVYCRENIFIPEGIEDIAIKAIQVLGLDFGAVDIIWNEKQNQCYVLEVNTAPGLVETTLHKYVKQFK